MAGVVEGYLEMLLAKPNIRNYDNRELEHLISEINPRPFSAFYLGEEIKGSEIRDYILLKWVDKYGFVVAEPRKIGIYYLMYFEKQGSDFELTKSFSTARKGLGGGLRLVDYYIDGGTAAEYINAALNAPIPGQM
jgi:hypothetical protein